MHIVSLFPCERKGGNCLIAALVLLIFVHHWRSSHFHLPRCRVAAPIIWPSHCPAIATAHWLEAAFALAAVGWNVPPTNRAVRKCCGNPRHQNGRGLVACGVAGGKVGALAAKVAAIACAPGAPTGPAAIGAPNSAGRGTHLMIAKFGV